MSAVKLISITQPTGELLGKSAEDLISYCGRVSNPANQHNFETAPKLLKYLIKHRHWSPFEMVDMTVEIKTSRAIAAQILRHRSFSFQEFSQRYSEVTELEPIQWRKQGKTNRQVGDESVQLDVDLQHVVDLCILDTLAVYKRLIDAGIAKECARMILPLTTQTTMYMKGSIRSWLSYFNVRLEDVTQKEHRDIARSISDIFMSVFPTVADACEFTVNRNGGFM
jgi:thymidylate synthase (FAD)